MRVFGYCRFSPSKDCGPHLAAQIGAVAKRAMETFGVVPHLYIDADKTGLGTNMHQFDLMLGVLRQSDEISSLVIDKLDRLGCDRNYLCKFFEYGRNSKLTVQCCETSNFLTPEMCIDFSAENHGELIDWLIQRFETASRKLHMRAAQHTANGESWGRPRIEIDPNIVQDAAHRNSGGEALTHIATSLNLPYSVLWRRVREYRRQESKTNP